MYYTFTWGGFAKKREDNRARNTKPRGKPRQKPKGPPKAKNFQARPPKKEKAIDPDNPFAALLALKDKS